MKFLLAFGGFFLLSIEIILCSAETNDGEKITRVSEMMSDDITAKHKNGVSEQKFLEGLYSEKLKFLQEIGVKWLTVVGKSYNEEHKGVSKIANNLNTLTQYDDLCTSLLNKAVEKNLTAIALFLINSLNETCTLDCFNNTPLHHAAYNNNVKLASALILKNSGYINCQNHVNETALLISARKNNTELFIELLNYGGEPYFRGPWGINSLHYAVLNNNIVIVETILNKTKLGIDAKNDEGETALMIASWRSTEAVFQILIESGADPSMMNNEYQTALHVAALTGSKFIVQILIKINKTDINIRDIKGRTPLHYAIYFYQIDIVNILLENHGDPYIRDVIGSTTLHAAAETPNNWKIVSIILHSDKTGINIKNDIGNTALHLATLMQHEPAVQLLVKNGAETCTANEKGLIPLHIAAWTGNLKIIQIILNINMICIDSKDNDGNTAMQITVYSNTIEAFNLLWENGADPYKKNSWGQTSLHIAVNSGNIDNLQNILNKNRTGINLLDHGGHTAIHLATLWKNVNLVLVLLNYGADPYIVDYKGYTCLHIAAESGIIDLLKGILQHDKSGVDAKNTNGDTALNCAVYSRNIAAVHALLDSKADPYKTDNKNQTAVHLAVLIGNQQILEIILNQNVTGINIQSINGNTALHYAVSYTKIPRNITLAIRTFDSILGEEKNEILTNTTDFVLFGKIHLYFKQTNQISDKEFNKFAYSFFSSYFFREQELYAFKVMNDLTDLFKQHEEHENYQKPGINFYEIFNTRLVSGDYKCVNITKDAKINEPPIPEFFFIQTALVETLLKYGADPKITDVNGRTSLNSAADSENADIIKLILNKEISVIDVPDYKGKTPLLVAVKKNYTAVTRVLLQNSADPFALDNEGETSLHVAARTGNSYIASLILAISNRGINYSNKIGETALMLAIKIYNSELCEILLKYGADPYIVDEDGHTLLHYTVLQLATDDIYEHSVLPRSELEFAKKRIFENSNKYSTFLGTIVNSRKYCYSKIGTIFKDGRRMSMYLPVSNYKTRELKKILGFLLNANCSGVNLKDRNGETALYFASSWTDVGVVRILLAKGGNSYIENSDGRTPLHAAACNSMSFYGSNFSDMIGDKSGIDKRDKNGFTALLFASLNMNLNTVIGLLESGANPNIPEYEFGWTPLHLAVKLTEWEPQEGLVVALINRTKVDLNVRNNDGKTPLHLVSTKSLLKHFLNKGAEILKDNRGWTPQHYAAFHGEIDLLKEFYSCSRASINNQAIFGESSLYLAVSNEKYHTAEYLLDIGADPAIANDNIETPLQILAANNNSYLFEIILKKGVNPISLNIFGFCAVHTAAAIGNLEILQLVVQRYAEAIDYPDRSGHTPLHYAANANQHHVLEYLLNQGADPFITDYYGHNVLHYASAKCPVSTLALIYQKAVEYPQKYEKTEFTNKINFADVSPLEVAAFHGNRDVFFFLWDKSCNVSNFESILLISSLGGDTDIIKYVLNRTKVFVDSKTVTGFTPIMAAAAHGRKDAFDLLLKEGANLSAVSTYGQTVLHYAGAGGNVEIIQTVMDHFQASLFSLKEKIDNQTLGKESVEVKDDINASDAEGYTPLMYAVERDQNDAVKLLLTIADPMVKNIYGDDCVTIAAQKGEVVFNSGLFNFSFDPDVVLGILLARKYVTYDEKVILNLVEKSSIGKYPDYLAAARGDASELRKIFSTSLKYPRKRSFPKIMKEFLRDYNKAMSDLIEDDESIPSYEERLTLLDVALLFRRNLTVVKLLVQELRTEISSVNYRESMWTSLDFAIMGHVAKLTHISSNVVVFLMQFCKDAINKSTNKYGWTLAHKAAWFGSWYVVRILMYYGLDLNRMDMFGRTPLHIAAINGNSQVVNGILSISKESINIKDQLGFSPLILSQIYNQKRFFSRLSVTISDLPFKERYKFLDFSSLSSKFGDEGEDSYLQTMATLIAYKADLNIQDKAFGWTALHWAAAAGDYHSVQLILSRGANVNVYSRTGETPMTIARKWGRKATYQYLKSKNGVW